MNSRETLEIDAQEGTAVVEGGSGGVARPRSSAREEPRPADPGLAGPGSDGMAAWCRRTFGSTTREGTVALVDQAVVSGTNFLTTVIVGRMCGADELGIYALGLSLVLLITSAHESLVSIPYMIYGNRLQGSPRARYAGSVLVHYAMLAMLAMICLALVGAALLAQIGPSRLAPAIWVLAGIIPFLLLREFGRRLAFAHMHMSTALGVDVVVSTIQIGGLVGLAAAGVLSAGTAYAALGLGCAVAGGAWFAFTRTKFAVRWEQVPRDLRRNWLLGRWVFAGLITFMIHLNVVHWLLALVIGTAATGAFAACVTVVMVSNPFVQGISNVLVPRMARAFAEGGVAEVRRVANKSTLLLGITMALFCAVIVAFGGQVVTLVYGSLYAGLGPTIAVLAVSVLVRALGMSAFIGLVAVERPDVNFKANLLGLGITVVLASCLMHAWGVVGGACGLLAGDIVAAAVRWCVFLRTPGCVPCRREREERAVAPPLIPE